MTEPLDDGRLIQASWSEPSRFSDLFDRHFVAVHQFCSRRAGRTESEDLAGETFCRAFEHRRRFDVTRPDARPWLYGIALNLIRTHQRSRFRRGSAYARSAFLGHDTVDFAAGVDQAVDARVQLEIVVQVMRQLPDDQFDMLLLHVWEHLSYDAIAEALEVSTGTVRSRLYHVREQFRDAIDRREPRRVARITTGERREP